MLKNCLRVSFSNNMHWAQINVNSILEYLKTEIPHLTEEALFDLRIIYSELIFNAIIHGNQQDAIKNVDLTIQIGYDDITSIVKDEGGGFDYSVLSKPSDSLDELFADRGRGLKLVLSLADDVRWNDAGNEILFCKKI